MSKLDSVPSEVIVHFAPSSAVPEPLHLAVNVSEDLGLAATTSTLHVAVLFPSAVVTVIVALPTPTAVTAPAFEFQNRHFCTSLM